MAESAREIENLIYRYARRIDAGDLEGLAELFAHGRILASPDAPPEHAVVGRDAVLALYRATVRIHEDGTPRTRHVTSNVAVEFPEGELPRARSVYTVFQQLEGFPLQPIVTGRYDDRFHEVDGRWWFESRTMFVDMKGDLSRHLKIDLG